MPLTPVSHSQAFDEYLVLRRGIIDLLRTAPSSSEQMISEKKSRLANVVYCSCVVLLTSYLERYVESLVVEAIDAINAANVPLQAIPARLKTAQVKELLHDLSLELHKDLTIARVTSVVQKGLALGTDYGWFLDETMPYPKLTGEPLIGENRFSNPAPYRIDELFRHLGISGLVGQVVGAEGKPDRVAVREKIREMVEKRNNIAHTGGTVTVTDQDVKSYLIYSRRLTRGIDVLVGKEVQAIIGGTWPWI